MANTIHFQLRGDAAANWEDKNPILFRNEPGYDMTNGRLKMGDGVTAWNDLPYLKTDITGKPVKITYDDGTEVDITWAGLRVDSITQASEKNDTHAQDDTGTQETDTTEETGDEITHG